MKDPTQDAPQEVTSPQALLEDREEAAELARLLALAPDPEVERRTQQRIEAANAAAPSRPSREQTRAARVAADFGLIILDDGSFAKDQPNGKVGHAMSVPAEWGEDDQPIAAATFRRHRTAVQRFAADVKRDRIAHATGARRARKRAGRREPRPKAARRSSSSSSTSAQDPGESDEPEPPSKGRQCAAPWCEHLVYGPSQKKYCGTDRCSRARAEERQRKHRTGDLTETERERLNDARVAGYVGYRAFAEPGEHSLGFLWRYDLLTGDDPGELEALLHRPMCRCNGHHIDGGAVGCFKCGLPRSAAVR